jgi:hypothetical protein
MTEHVKAAVASLLDAFKASPSLLFIILLNVLFLGGLGYLLIQIGDRRSEEFKYHMETTNKHYETLLDYCLKKE